MDNEIVVGAKMPEAKKIPEAPFIQMRRGADVRVHGDYNTVDMMEAESSKIAKLEMWIAKAVGSKLVSSYPNRQWGVMVDVVGGLVCITCPSLSTEKGYHLHIKGDNIMALSRRSVLAAGEILERYNLSRDKKFEEGAMDSLIRDSRGEAISIDSAPESST